MNSRPLLYNRRIERIHPLISPQQMLEKIPVSDASCRTVLTGRKEVEAILSGADNRFLLIVGPCSIHDPSSALDYAKRLMRLRIKYRDAFCIIMRVYFEKPRTGLGWRGLIVEPALDGVINITGGLETARKTLSAITELGLPALSAGHPSVRVPPKARYIENLLRGCRCRSVLRTLPTVISARR